MATFTKVFLSEAGTNNLPIHCTGSTNLHFPTTTAGQMDEVWLWLGNSNSSDKTNIGIIAYNNSTATNLSTFTNYVTVPVGQTVLVLAGVVLNASGYSANQLAIRLTGGTPGLYAYGFVNRIS